MHLPRRTIRATIKNKMGLHTRPATAIVKLLQNYRSEVTFEYNEEQVNAKSILSLLLLAAKKNAKIKITVVGEDADQVVHELLTAFNNGFGEFL